MFSFRTLLLLASITTTISHRSCEFYPETCSCFPGSNIELHCPRNATEDDLRFVLHVEHDTIKINCNKMDIFRFDLLPMLQEEDNFRLIVNYCPLPPEGFKPISDRFSTKLEVLQFETSNENVTLTKNSFSGLNLERLKLNVLNITLLDDDVFSELGGLYALEMEHNKNLTLPPRVFQNLTNLEILYLGQNNLQNLDGLFDSLVKLRILHLWNNNLTAIKNTTFESLGSLTSLDLNTNKIEEISRGAFYGLKNLSFLNLSGNRLTTLPAEVFKNSIHLEEVYMRNNFELQLPDYLFAGLASLRKVDLARSNLTFIPDHVFENCVNLTILNVRDNKLNVISPYMLKRLVNLEKLDFENNQLIRIEDGTFRDLVKLKELNLKNNRIGTIGNNAFTLMNSLVNVNLAHNFLESVDFGDAVSLVKVDLSYNQIRKVENVFVSSNLLHLENLYLDGNLITEVQLQHLQPSNQNLYISLDQNNITTITLGENLFDLSSIGKTTISLIDNPLECTCNLYEFLQFQRSQISKTYVFENLTCQSPQKFLGANLENLSLSDLTCDVEESSGCPRECFYQYRPYDTSVVMDCSNKNLTEFPEIDHELNCTYNQTEIHLEFNNLTAGPKKSEGYSNITRLFLSNNRIKSVDWLPPRLEVLYLDNNEVNSLNGEAVEILQKLPLVALSLHHNQWRCDCSAANLTNFLREHARLNIENVLCHHNGKPLVHFTEADLCHNIVLIILLPVVTVVFLFMLTLVLFLRYQELIKIWLFAHNLCLTWVTEEDLDKDKLYDAFISYSHKDEDFVTQNLVPVLEGSPNPYKLCLHYRDFVPGEFIITQVTKSVLDSRRTLVVLSPNFLESVWGKAEFRTAHTQAMTEGRARVIIVLYGEVEVEKLDEELKAYLNTNTYVKWGDPYFWRKLKYALPHSNKGSNNNQKIANVINCIDDKFSIVKPKKVRTRGLKKDPLEFVGRQEVGTPVDDSLVVTVC